VNADIHLIAVKLESLRPTQITVGYREVAEKRAHWATLGKKARAAAIESHWFPAVLGPNERYYITDHHHLGLALLEEGVDEVKAMLLKDMSWLDETIFWRMMEHNQWVHPFGADGARRGFAHPPKAITGLVDDSYRRLAGELRRTGGYAKDTTPFAEFLWSDFLRPLVPRELIGKRFDKALDMALAHAHSAEARYLPGWSGTMAAQ
jgi:hypothetical protein